MAEAGIALAASLGTAISAELAELPHDEHRLLTSPARRCRQTAVPIGDALGLAAGRHEVVPELIEIDYGAWDGLTPEECRARDPELRARWEADPFGTRCPDGESGQDVARRAFPVLEAIESWVAADRARCAVVVSHNHVTRLRVCHLLGWPMSAYRDRVVADAGAYSLLTLGPGFPVVRRVNVPGA